MKETFRCQNLLATSICAQRCMYGHKQCEKVGETWTSTINYAVVTACETKQQSWCAHEREIKGDTWGKCSITLH